MSIVVVCAHPDDELACAGALARHASKGEDVLALFVGTGVGARGERGQELLDAREHRLMEAQIACNAVGIREFRCLGFEEDNALDTVPFLRVVQEIEKVLVRWDADVVYTHWAHDVNVDHRVVHRAVLTATRPTPMNLVRALYAFEVAGSTEWNFGVPPYAPNVFVALTPEEVEKKGHAIAAYRSERKMPPHPRSAPMFDALARWRGSQCGHPWAEAFMLLREVRG